MCRLAFGIKPLDEAAAPREGAGRTGLPAIGVFSLMRTKRMIGPPCQSSRFSAVGKTRSLADVFRIGSIPIGRR